MTTAARSMLFAVLQGAANGEPLQADMRALVYNQAVAGGSDNTYQAVASLYAQVCSP